MVDLTDAEVAKACDELEGAMVKIEAEAKASERAEAEMALRRALVSRSLLNVGILGHKVALAPSEPL